MAGGTRERERERGKKFSHTFPRFGGVLGREGGGAFFSFSDGGLREGGREGGMAC